jgi:hypothetical protein
MLNAYSREKGDIIEKCLTIGTYAARMKVDEIARQNTQKNTDAEKLQAQTIVDDHRIIANARNSYKALEEDRQKRLEQLPDSLQSCSHIEKQEIVWSMYQCYILTGHNVKELVLKSLRKTLHESVRPDHHLQDHTKQRETVRGIIQHTLQQHSKGVTVIEPIHPEEAHRAHQQEQRHLQKAIQSVHTQTQHLEQQREIERGVHRGFER